MVIISGMIKNKNKNKNMNNLIAFESFFKKRIQKWSENEVQELESRGFIINNDIYTYIPEIASNDIKKISIDKKDNNFFIDLKTQQVENDIFQRIISFDDALFFIDSHLPDEDVNFRRNTKEINKL